MKKYVTIGVFDVMCDRVNNIDHRVYDNESEIAKLKNEVRVLRHMYEKYEKYEKSGFLYRLLHWR